MRQVQYQKDQRLKWVETQIHKNSYIDNDMPLEKGKQCTGHLEKLLMQQLINLKAAKGNVFLTPTLFQVNQIAGEKKFCYTDKSQLVNVEEVI